MTKVAIEEDTTSGSGTGTCTREAFQRHQDSVLCCSVDTLGHRAVSGGVDDTAYVWNIQTKHLIFKVDEHKESVVAAAFSAKSTHVATGDLNGYIIVRNTTTGLTEFEYEVDEINWIIWHNTSDNVLFAGTTKGEFWMWNITDPSQVKTFPSYGHSATAARLMPNGTQMVVAYGDGSVRLFDLKKGQMIQHLANPAECEAICLDICLSKALLAVGYIDSTVKLITCGNFKTIGVLRCETPPKAEQQEKDQRAIEEGLQETHVREEEEEEVETEEANAEPVEVIDDYTNNTESFQVEAEHENDDNEESSDDEEEEMDYGPDIVSVECVLFSPCGNYLVAANNSGSICIWDVSTQVTRCQLHTGVGITRCAWSVNGNLITACLDGYVRTYDMNLTMNHEVLLHGDQILDIAYRDCILVTASEDKTCRVIMI